MDAVPSRANLQPFTVIIQSLMDVLFGPPEKFCVHLSHLMLRLTWGKSLGTRKPRNWAETQNMPKKARELSALEVRRLKHPGYHAVGVVPGLHLQVTPTGARSWILRAQVGNRRRDRGSCPGVHGSDRCPIRRGARCELVGDRPRRRNLDIFGGKPIIRGHRLAVEHVLGMLATGDTPEAILDAYPWLEWEDIRPA